MLSAIDNLFRSPSTVYPRVYILVLNHFSRSVHLFSFPLSSQHFFPPGTVDPNRPIDDRNKEKQNVNYASVAIGVVVAVVVLLIVLILFTKRKSIKKCFKPEKQNKNKPEVEEVKANGENEKLAQMQQEHELA